MPKVIYIAPCFPAATGSGIAMRCAMFLEALQAKLAVVPLVHTGTPIRPDAKIFPVAAPPSEAPRQATHPGDVGLAGWNEFALPDLWDADAALLPSLSRTMPRELPDMVYRWLKEEAPDVVVVSRLYLAPVLQKALADLPATFVLDLDDRDAALAAQLAHLYAEHGEAVNATRWLGQAQRFALLERLLVPRFDVVSVASLDDAKGQLVHIPNAPPAINVQRSESPAGLLFVGSLSYTPNVHGLAWFVQRVWPLIQARHPTTLTIVGRAPSAPVLRLAETPGVVVVPDALDLASHYARAQAAICPVFVGAGSRIKLLEAFAARVPVVTTTRGAQGLGVTPDTQALFGDTPETFADACVTLLTDPTRAQALTQAAAQLCVPQSEVHARIRNLIS